MRPMEVNGMDSLKRLCCGALLLFVGFFFAVFVAMMLGVEGDGGGMRIFGLIMAAINGAFMWKLGKIVFGRSKSQAQIPQQPFDVEVSPEMDHRDDMAMQYNPYFADVYAEQEEALRREQQQQIQQQRLQNSMMQQQMVRQQAQQAQLQAELLEQQAQELRARAEEMQRQADMTRLQ